MKGHPEGYRLTAEPTKDLSHDDIHEIDTGCRTIAIGCIKAALRDAGSTTAEIAAEVHNVVSFLASCDTASEDWRRVTFLYTPNIFLSFDALLDPELPYMPAHMRPMYQRPA